MLVRCSHFGGRGVGALAASILWTISCSSSSTPSQAGPSATSTTCASPGSATQGPADTHCQGQPPQPVDEASCSVTDAGDDGGMNMGDDGGMGMGDDSGSADSCPYGATMYGQHGNDDDCKYWVAWTSDPICEGSGGVQFTVAVWSNVDGSPVTGIPNGIVVEAFIPASLDASCDDVSHHESPGSASSPYLTEVEAGSGIYKGPVVFDAAGEWTVRFHIHEECADVLPTSPHGHAAFHVTVP